MSPDLVAPMVAFLAHEDCPVSGEIYAAGAGRFARIFIASTAGIRPRRTAEPTIEDVAAHWAAINDETGYYVPADLIAWSAAFMAHLHPDADPAAPSWSRRIAERPPCSGRGVGLLVEQVGLLVDDPVVERLELQPPGAVPADLAGGLLRPARGR